MRKEYVDVLVDLEKYYQDAVLPEFGITQQASWERHVKTNPDNFLHILQSVTSNML